MTTRGVADIVFCLDASDSMAPCIDGVRMHVTSFVQGLQGGQQGTWDLRMDFLAHSCSLDGSVIHTESLRHAQFEVVRALYGNGNASQPQGGGFFTASVDDFRDRLASIATSGNEQALVGLDLALDFPWRPASKCHRVVIQMTDEPFETGASLPEQEARLADLIQKIQDLRVMLFLVAPDSPVFSKLSEVDRCEYTVVDSRQSGLEGVDFREVLSFIGKSVSVSTLQQTEPTRVRRGLFGQDKWGITNGGNFRERTAP